jgi:hypothetical protein
MAVKAHFNDTAGERNAKMLSVVITDYGNYPGFNPSVTDVAVLSLDESGAEFLAGRKTRIGKTCTCSTTAKPTEASFGIERTYDGVDGSSTWTVRSAGEGRSALTIDGTMRVSLPRPGW